MSEICASALNDIWNNEKIAQESYSNNLKLADVAPVFKKEDASFLKNYRRVRVQPIISKIYERIMQEQVLEFIDKHLSPHLFEYRKGYNTKAA